VCGGANDRDSGLLKLITNCRHTHSLTLAGCVSSHTHTRYLTKLRVVSPRVSGGVTKDAESEKISFPYARQPVLCVSSHHAHTSPHCFSLGHCSIKTTPSHLGCSLLISREICGRMRRVHQQRNLFVLRAPLRHRRALILHFFFAAEHAPLFLIKGSSVAVQGRGKIALCTIPDMRYSSSAII
jgi:hypothetical protein